MSNFMEFLKLNDKEIKRVASENTIINFNGTVVISKNDIWRKETEWDIMYDELKG